MIIITFSVCFDFIHVPAEVELMIAQVVDVDHFFTGDSSPTGALVGVLVTDLLILSPN